MSVWQIGVLLIMRSVYCNGGRFGVTAIKRLTPLFSSEIKSPYRNIRTLSRSSVCIGESIGVRNLFLIAPLSGA